MLRIHKKFHDAVFGNYSDYFTNLKVQGKLYPPKKKFWVVNHPSIHQLGLTGKLFGINSDILYAFIYSPRIYVSE